MSSWRNRLKVKFKDSVDFIDPLDFYFNMHEGEHRPDCEDRVDYKVVVETGLQGISKSDFVISKLFAYSPGTLMEMAYSKVYMKPVILLTKEDLCGPFVKYHSNHVCYTESELDFVISNFVDDFYARRAK